MRHPSGWGFLAWFLLIGMADGSRVLTLESGPFAVDDAIRHARSARPARTHEMGARPMKLHVERSKVILGIVTLSAILIVLPACSATAQHQGLRADCPPGSTPTRRSAFRPILSQLPSRTYYLSGYAGATYPPLGQRAPVDPTTTRAARRPIFSGWFGRP